MLIRGWRKPQLLCEGLFSA